MSQRNASEATGRSLVLCIFCYSFVTSLEQTQSQTTYKIQTNKTIFVCHDIFPGSPRSVSPAISNIKANYRITICKEKKIGCVRNKTNKMFYYLYREDHIPPGGHRVRPSTHPNYLFSEKIYNLNTIS